ncbi:hypothetical protein, variant 1 [Phytophthora nicotianae CJ01A1]|uniref:Uncharacterized protein n=2 Tax=Phytophthora nicotianae TaxID=4792 RepID=W2IUX4_PHYNI|nr:hypothetical protein, variant 1 [Phytophthora nicotianae]ETL37173.1 hypothetical protein, variant 1 [Phytophthora nicotianae]ETP13516.1 hypothetical protein, variant 1 [Phytophthora nicotianae CJ01A1]
MVDKSELVAYEREKRLYKDAYVENFRSVRYFPSLATIGAGRTDGDSIVLVQEPQVPDADCTPPKDVRSRLDDVASRLIPPDSLEEIFDTTLPLTTFRSAIMCKHSKARQERRAAEAASGAGSASKADLVTAACRYKGYSKTVRLHTLTACRFSPIQSSAYLPTKSVALDSCMHTIDSQACSSLPALRRPRVPFSARSRTTDNRSRTNRAPCDRSRRAHCAAQTRRHRGPPTTPRMLAKRFAAEPTSTCRPRVPLRPTASTRRSSSALTWRPTTPVAITLPRTTREIRARYFLLQ